MSQQYTLYEMETGRIISRVENISKHLLINRGVGVVSGHFGDDYYFLNHRATLRPVMSAAADKLTLAGDFIDRVLIFDLPVPCFMTVSGTGIEFSKLSVSDGEIEYQATDAGVHKITVEAFPFLSKEFLIHVSE